MNPSLFSDPLSQKGIIDTRKVRKALFALSATCIFACVVVSILAIWDYVGNQYAVKFLASCLVLVAGGALFEAMNRTFGKALDQLPAESK
jgi:uncharacterized membrane protein YjjP (DUF1212 family)